MVGRRELMVSGLLGGLALAGRSEAAESGVPRLELALEIIADIAPVQNLGAGPLGDRRIVPIIGGSFEGRGALGAGLRGKVMPGGADRQLVRTDGVRNLSALYELQAEDGAVITVLNKVLVEDLPGGGRYAFSTPEIAAPKGPHDWLNHHVFVGTLDSLRPARSAVRVRFYRLF